MTETEYRERIGDKLPRLSRREVDLIASGYEWGCPACGEFHREIAIYGAVICTCGKRFRVNSPEHAYG